MKGDCTALQFQNIMKSIVALVKEHSSYEIYKQFVEITVEFKNTINLKYHPAMIDLARKNLTAIHHQLEQQNLNMVCLQS